MAPPPVLKVVWFGYSYHVGDRKVLTSLQIPPATVLASTRGGGIPLTAVYRDEILGHQFNERIEPFSPCCSHIHSSFYWRIFKNTILYSGFNNLYKKSENNKT
jgi:hypothetical protein